MTDGWSWFWASDWRKGEILREEVDTLNSAIAAANSRSYRLTSQLQTLSGSIESRLQALSAAFDAYVELGDVREQLTAYPHTAAIRRDTVAAIEALAAGRTPEPVDPRDADYWLAYATNAVLAIAAGGRDREAEETATALSADAERFVVSACGALGHGAAVEDRVPALLVSDGRLSAAQLALWEAVVAGLYGAALEEVGRQWHPLLAEDAAAWVAWVEASARSAARPPLEWVADQTLAGWVETGTAPAPPADAAAGLRAVVTEAVNRGLGAEGELLARSRELRARIEHPGAAPTPDRAAATEEPTVLDEVRATYVSLPPEHPVHRALTAWLADGMLSALPELERRATQMGPAEVSVRTSDGVLDVTPDGVDERRRAQIHERIALAHTIPVSRVVLPAVGAGALLVAGIAAAVASSTGLLVLSLVIALGVGAYALVEQRRRRTAVAEGARRLAAVEQTIRDGQAQAREVAAAQAQSVTEARALAAEVTERLRSLVPAGTA